MSVDALDAYLYGLQVARVSGGARGELVFTEQAMARWGYRSAVLSALLPLTEPSSPLPPPGSGCGCPASCPRAGPGPAWPSGRASTPTTSTGSWRSTAGTPPARSSRVVRTALEGPATALTEIDRRTHPGVSDLAWATVEQRVDRFLATTPAGRLRAPSRNRRADQPRVPRGTPTGGRFRAGSADDAPEP